MSFSATHVPTTQNATSDGNRESASYHPSLWGDNFLAYDSTSKATDDPSVALQFQRLEQEVRSILTNKMTDKPDSQKLRLIDAVERLGVAYHFNSEIEDALQKLGDKCHDIEDDLYSTSLRFRLLRQKGINVSCDAFEKFKDIEGNFKASLNDDVPSLLSLHEAAHLGIKGEDILDQALAFTTTCLETALTHVSTPMTEQTTRALNRPIRKCLPRLEARYFISAYPALDESHNSTLLNFAKLDFNILQGLHQRELHGIMQWWKSLDVAAKLPYVRDRVVECYFWITGVYFEPQFSLARKILTKVIATLTILDDTYDNYGTNEELELFTEAIQRWDIGATDSLPGYMKMIYLAIIDVYNEIEASIAKERRSFCMHYAKEAMKTAVHFYNVEAKWRNEGYVPSMEEYMDVSLYSCCYPLLVTTSFLGMGDLATEDAFKWVSNNPKIVRASSIICRLMDDIVGHGFEQARKHVASSVECGMKQYGVSEEEVVKLLREEIKNAWKDINEEWLNPKEVPMPLLERVLNFTRVIDVIYKDDDGFTNSYILKDDIASLLRDPVIL